MSLGFNLPARAARGAASPYTATRTRALRPRRGACALLAALLAWAASADAGPFDAGSSRAAREDAVRSIPLDKLDQAERSAVAAVLANPSIFRRLPAQVIDCDPVQLGAARDLRGRACRERGSHDADRGDGCKCPHCHEVPSLTGINDSTTPAPRGLWDATAEFKL